MASLRRSRPDVVSLARIEPVSKPESATFVVPNYLSLPSEFVGGSGSAANCAAGCDCRASVLASLKRGRGLTGPCRSLHRVLGAEYRVRHQCTRDRVLGELSRSHQVLRTLFRVRSAKCPSTSYVEFGTKTDWLRSGPALVGRESFGEKVTAIDPYRPVCLI